LLILSKCLSKAGNGLDPAAPVAKKDCRRSLELSGSNHITLADLDKEPKLKPPENYQTLFNLKP
jgi:hypothetical protein